MADEEKNNQISDNEKRVIADGFIAAAKDLESHQAALKRLTENQAAEHAKMEEIVKLVNEQTTAITLTRDLVLHLWKHLGLPEEQILPKSKGGVN